MASQPIAHAQAAQAHCICMLGRGRYWQSMAVDIDGSSSSRSPAGRQVERVGKEKAGLRGGLPTRHSVRLAVAACRPGYRGAPQSKRQTRGRAMAGRGLFTPVLTPSLPRRAPTLAVLPGHVNTRTRPTTRLLRKESKLFLKTDMDTLSND